MGFFYRLKQSFLRFMMGRNGADQFGLALMVTYLVVSLLSQWIENTVGLVLYLAAYAILIYALFRMLSRNLAKRQAENRKFLTFWYKVKGVFKRSPYRTVKDPTKVIRKCPACKAKLRLPKKKGRHSVTCPKCRHTFDVRI